jgi:hypothetical protein
MSEQQLASKRKHLTMVDPEDDELALSEIEAQVIRSDDYVEARKDDNGRVVFLRVVSTLFPSSIAKLTKLKSLRITKVHHSKS